MIFSFSFDAHSYFVLGHLEHDVIYNGLRGIFQARGPVCFMFVHKVCMQGRYEAVIDNLYLQSAVKDNDSGKLVKFGYVVFAEKGVAQKVLKEGYIHLEVARRSD